MEQLYHQFGEAIATILVWGVLLAVARLVGLWKLAARLLKPKPKPAPTIEATNAISRQQKDILRELLTRLGATRCYLTKVHNGDHYVDGSEILRCSRAVEVTKFGTSFEAERFKNLLISTLLDEQKFVEDDGPGWFVTSTLPPSTFRHINQLTGTRAGARAALKKNNEIVGFVGADFDHDDKPANLNEIVQYARWLEKTL